MVERLIKCYLYSVSVLLSLTALAKLVSAAGSAKVLDTEDPIFHIRFRYVFVAVAGLELMVALACVLAKPLRERAGLVAWLAASFLFYRFGLYLVGYHRACGCLGNLTDALHLSPDAVDIAMKIVLGYFTVGSGLALLSLGRVGSAKLASREVMEGPSDLNLEGGLRSGR